MKNLLFASIVWALCAYDNLFAEDKINHDRQSEFQRLTLQRSWHYASLLIESGSPEVKQEHARIMVTAVFHYWMMRQNNLIEEMSIYEEQVRKTFRDKKLNSELLNDPLGRYSTNAPKYLLPKFNISDEDYKKAIPRFKDFILVH